MFDKSILYGNAIIRHLMNGGKIVGEPIYEARATICRRCPSNKENVCQECGCNLEGDSAFVSKLLMPTEHCPLHKWCQYDPNGFPIAHQSPNLYQINMMLNSEGQHIHAGFTGIKASNTDPLDNSKYGEIEPIDLSEAEKQVVTEVKPELPKKQGGCGCGK